MFTTVDCFVFWWLRLEELSAAATADPLYWTADSREAVLRSVCQTESSASQTESSAGLGRNRSARVPKTHFCSERSSSGSSSFPSSDFLLVCLFRSLVCCWIWWESWWERATSSDDDDWCVQERSVCNSLARQCRRGPTTIRTRWHENSLSSTSPWCHQACRDLVVSSPT